jgi:DNA-binding response OmpR family regulator
MTTAVSLFNAAQQTQTDVLLIDDSVADLRVLMDMMNLKDLRVSVAMSGERGFQQAILLKPSLVLMDVRMPGMDGIATCRQLKAHPAVRSIPVIFLTAANDLAERLEGFAAGAVDYIGKPFEVQEVLARVGVHLQRTWAAQELADEASNAVPSEASVDVRLVVSAQQVLRQTLPSPPSLDRLARLVGTNRRRLNEAFQALCGQPVFGWLREERLRQANSQVSGTSTPFSVLSDALGYSTPANFSKAFRQRFGCSPSQMRAQLQGVLEPDPDSEWNFAERHTRAEHLAHDLQPGMPQGPVQAAR